MNFIASMLSSFSGFEQWEFPQILEYSKKTSTELSASHEFLIDVREVDEIRNTAAIPNSINIPLGLVDETLKSPIKLSKFLKGTRDIPTTSESGSQDKLIFTCQSGMRAGRAASMAKSAGFEKIAVYSGSYSDWSSKMKSSK